MILTNIIILVACSHFTILTLRVLSHNSDKWNDFHQRCHRISTYLLIITTNYSDQCLSHVVTKFQPVDSTYSVAHKDPVSLSAKLTNKYSVMADYLTDNRLKLNDDKTHLLVMTTRGRRLNDVQEFLNDD